MNPWFTMLARIRFIRFERKTVVSLSVGLMAVFVFLSLFFVPHIARAQDEGDTFGLAPIGQSIKLGNEDIRVIAARIIVVILGLLGIIAFGLILYAGFLIMTSAGNEEKILQGKRVLINATIGFLIIASAFSIVQFILKSLSDATGMGTGTEEDSIGEQSGFGSFSGTGALGWVIKDHYPRPNQADVARNTKIAITFAEAIEPGSLSVNTNNTCWPKDDSKKPIPIGTGANCAVYPSGADKGKPIPYFGDCFDSNGDKGISWDTECDQVNTNSVQLFLASQATSTKKDFVPMAVLASYNKDGKAFIFTFKPLNPIGSDIENIWHTVKLLGGSDKSKGIKKLDGADIFPKQYINKFYTWNFQTNTKIDLTPPHILSVWPYSGNTILRNTIVQIQFSEPMDPSVTQGVLSQTGTFSNIIFGDPQISGEWRISNGYRTLEFTPSEPCGTNSCGEVMYCLPTKCPPTDTKCLANYSSLVRTAALSNPTDNSFQSQPFTGVADMAANALDNGPNNKPDGILSEALDKSWRHKPTLPGDFKTIGAAESSPDNYFWSFKVQNDIDRSVPYIKNVTPNLEGEGVKGTDPIRISFSKKMLSYSLSDGVGVLEYPEGVKGKDGVKLDPFANYVQSYDEIGTGLTIADIEHPRVFGPNGLDLYYFTFVSSSVKSNNQNCLYPGRGPNALEKNSAPICTYSEDANGVGTGTNCVPVTFDASSDTGCVFDLVEGDKIQPDVTTCLNKMKAGSKSAYSTNN